MAGQVNGSTTASLTSTFAAGFTVLGFPMNSLFLSSPGTSCLQAYFSNLNIFVYGSNILQSNYKYDEELFSQKVRGSNAINGGILLGLSLSLLSTNDSENRYRFVYIDLSRRLAQANDDISRSFQVIFTNSVTHMMDYFFEIGFGRKIAISSSTAALKI